MIIKYLIRFGIAGILTFLSSFATGKDIYAESNLIQGDDQAIFSDWNDYNPGTESIATGQNDEGMQLFRDTSLNINDFIDAGENPIDADDFFQFENKEAGEDNQEENREEKNSSEQKPEGNNKKETGSGTKEGIYIPQSDMWKLILVNKQNPVPDDYKANLVSVGNMQVDERIASDTAKMLKAAKNDGVDLVICSAYRSYDKQTDLFNRKIKKFLGSGMNYMEAYAQASYSVTVPGTSEHQLGLALDIVTPSYSSLNEGYADTDGGKWLYEHCMEYGFIMRYPKGKENITGIIFEPWHFRYVGKKYAKEISEMGITLEEYLEYAGLK